MKPDYWKEAKKEIDKIIEELRWKCDEEIIDLKNKLFEKTVEKLKERERAFMKDLSERREKLKTEIEFLLDEDKGYLLTNKQYVKIKKIIDEVMK